MYRNKISVMAVVWYSRLRTSALAKLIGVIFAIISLKNRNEIRNNKSSPNALGFNGLVLENVEKIIKTVNSM